MSDRSALAVLQGWGGVHQGRSVVYRPQNFEEAEAALRDAADQGLSVAHRGSGYSYGDLAVNEGGAVIETRTPGWAGSRPTAKVSSGVTATPRLRASAAKRAPVQGSDSGSQK